MTLLAAYREHGVPILIGDFLITAGRKGVGLKKKLHRIQSNLVVGWTGHQFAAEFVISRLYETFQQESATSDGLKRLLTGLSTEDVHPMSVRLAGWLNEGEARCFAWNSLWRQEVFYPEYHFDGSGADEFQRIVGTGAGPSPGGRKDDPIRRALYATSLLLADEVGPRRYQNLNFGHAYEFLYLKDGMFEYADDIVFVFFELWFNSIGKFMGPRMEFAVYKIHHESHFAIVQISTIGKTRHFQHDYHLISPLYGASTAEADAVLQAFSADRISFEGRYYSFFASFIKDAETPAARALPPVIRVISADDPIQAFKVFWDKNAGAFELAIPSEEDLELAYRRMLEMFPSAD